MRKMIASSVGLLDNKVSNLHRNLFGEKNGLISVLFHALSDDEDDCGISNVDPLLKVSAGAFRNFCEYFLENGFEFISPEQILAGLDPQKKYILITFDDGYFNNRLALPVLEEFNIPAVFFIAPNYIIENKGYWWDIVYRESSKREVAPKEICALQESLKTMKIQEIYSYIIENFGQEAIVPLGDSDRPFSTHELKEFAKHPLVHIGNHTNNHQILTNCSPDEIRQEVSDAQNNLESITGKTPVMISYPNGNVSKLIIDVVKNMGINLGISTYGMKTPLPLKEDKRLLINRFGVHSGNIKQIASSSRSDMQLLRCIMMWKKRYANENRMFNQD